MVKYKEKREAALKTGRHGFLISEVFIPHSEIISLFHPH
jgi:hypothetical protein